jgi:hypothetical protein
MIGTGVALSQKSDSWRPVCMAGHVGLELRNVVANYPFESSRGFPRSEPNFGRVDHSHLSCSAGDGSSGWVLPRFARTLVIMRRNYRPSGSETAARSAHVLACAGLGAVALALGIVSPERRLHRQVRSRRTRPARQLLRPGTRRRTRSNPPST